MQTMVTESRPALPGVGQWRGAGERGHQGACGYVHCLECGDGVHVCQVYPSVHFKCVQFTVKSIYLSVEL